MIHIPQLSLSPQRREYTSFLTARWLGFSFLTMIHRQTLIKGLQSQGTVALKSYLKKFLYIMALIWKAPYDMTDWLGNKENNLWHSLWSTLWNKAPGTEISHDLSLFFFLSSFFARHLLFCMDVWNILLFRFNRSDRLLRYFHRKLESSGAKQLKIIRGKKKQWKEKFSRPLLNQHQNSQGNCMPAFRIWIKVSPWTKWNKMKINTLHLIIKLRPVACLGGWVQGLGAVYMAW